MDYINKIKQFNKEIDNESDETTIIKIKRQPNTDETLASIAE